MAEIQRARIVAAMVQVLCDEGGANVSVAHIVERAGVSRRTFYELFADRDDCFMAAFEEALAAIQAPLVSAYANGDRWQECVRGALVEILSFCEREPQLARVLLVESAAGGPALLARRAELLGCLNAAVQSGLDRRGAKAAHESVELAALTAEGVVGGVSTVISARLAATGVSTQVDFLALTGPLMSMIVLPYLGAAAARREAARAVPGHAEPLPAQAGPPVEFHGLGIRLTYRTLRVLMSVAERPGASNREIGQSAGMGDQGQISKLLARLHRVGLIENTSTVSMKGAPNSWALTEKGTQIAEGLRISAGDPPR